MIRFATDPRDGEILLLEKMAKRLGEISLVMGMDDEDELLLWQYVALTPEGEILECVKKSLQSAIFDPYVLSRCEWSASFPKRFYNPSRRLKSRFGRKYLLTQKGDATVVGSLASTDIILDLKLFEDQVREAAQHQCFMQWINEVQSVLDPNGVKWHAPGQEHVSVHINIDALRLADKLGN